MQDGNLKASLIVAVGLLYAGAGWCVTEYAMQQDKQRPTTNFDECIWRSMSQKAFSPLSEKDRIKVVIDSANKCMPP